MFVTLVVPESRIARPARESGGGLEGRCRELHLLMGEVGAHLTGPLGMTSVRWLTSPELAVTCRTGFAPGDRAGIIDALAAHAVHPEVNADVPWAMAGPSGADTTVRHYSHDAWNSISSTIKLPTRGAVMGALAPALTPSEPGERRSFLVAYPLVSPTKADRQSAMPSGQPTWPRHEREDRTQDTCRAARRPDRHARVRRQAGACSAMTRPYAVVTVTVAKTARIAEYGRRLDSDVRRAGFAPLRLDLAQDVGFAASTVPMGISLTRRGGA